MFPSSLGIGPVHKVVPKRTSGCLDLTRECSCTVDSMSVIPALSYDAKIVLTSPGRVVLPAKNKQTNISAFSSSRVMLLCL